MYVQYNYGNKATVEGKGTWGDVPTQMWSAEAKTVEVGFYSHEFYHANINFMSVGRGGTVLCTLCYTLKSCCKINLHEHIPYNLSLAVAI